MSSKDTAANVVRFAQAIEKEQPYLLKGIRKISVLSLPHAETGLHKIIRDWGLSLPLDLYYFNKGILFAPMIKPKAWLEYLLCNKPGILLGGFSTDHFALPSFLESFWQAYKFEDGDHEVFQRHSDHLGQCIPYCLFTDEGRGLRKAPVQIVALETLWNIKTFEACQRMGAWNDETFWAASQHTGSGSSLTSRLLLYVLPHRAYKKKQKQFWFDVLDVVVRDLATLFDSGIDIGGRRFYPVLVGVKGDAPALSKVGCFTRSFNHILGRGGVCHHCLAGQGNHRWEDLTPRATWLDTLYVERPWKARRPSCVLPIPFSNVAPEKVFRSDSMHLVKLGIARHFIASTIIAFGDWGVFPNSASSIATLLEKSHEDFVWCCKHEIKQTPNLKMFSKEGLHWPRRSSFPFGGFLAFFFSFVFLCSEFNLTYLP